MGLDKIAALFRNDKELDMAITVDLNASDFKFKLNLQERMDNAEGFLQEYLYQLLSDNTAIVLTAQQNDTGPCFFLNAALIGAINQLRADNKSLPKLIAFGTGINDAKSPLVKEDLPKLVANLKALGIKAKVLSSSYSLNQTQQTAAPMPAPQAADYPNHPLSNSSSPSVVVH